MNLKEAQSLVHTASGALIEIQRGPASERINQMLEEGKKSLAELDEKLDSNTFPDEKKRVNEYYGRMVKLHKAIRNNKKSVNNQDVAREIQDLKVLLFNLETTFWKKETEELRTSS